LKGRYKGLSGSNQKFCIKVEKGEYAVIVFKPIVPRPVWPSKAFNFYRKELKKSVIQNNEPSAKASIIGDSKIASK
jgi:hypothetical protein